MKTVNRCICNIHEIQLWTVPMHYFTPRRVPEASKSITRLITI